MGALGPSWDGLGTHLGTNKSQDRKPDRPGPNGANFLGRFWSPKWHPKSHKKRPQSPGPAQSPPRARPEASREPFGRHFGLILASIWALRGLMFELFRGARLLLLACCSSIAGALFLMRPLLRCSPSELPGYEAQVTKAIASWPRSLVASCLRSSGGRRQEGVAP